jgi:hypothetical protein
MVRSAYNLQQLRIEMGHRLTATFKHKLGGKAGQKEEERHMAMEASIGEMLTP